MLVCDEASADFNWRLPQSLYGLTPDAYLESLWRGRKLRAGERPNPFVLFGIYSFKPVCSDL